MSAICWCNMAKVICLVLFVVAVSLSSVQADDDEDNSKFDLDNIIFECAEKFDISEKQFSAAISTFQASALAPCFWSCCFKKVGVLNSEGQYDVDATLDIAKKIFGNQDFDKYGEIVKKCASVNDESVSDGSAGCERGLLLATCMFENTKKKFMN